MAYATLAYYKFTYKGASYDDTETEKWLERASDDLDIATCQGITGSDLELYQLNLVRKANCAQAEELITGGDNGDLASVSLGKFSYSGGSSRKPGSLCDRAAAYLSQSGLMFAGIQLSGTAYCD